MRFAPFKSDPGRNFRVSPLARRSIAQGGVPRLRLRRFRGLALHLRSLFARDRRVLLVARGAAEFGPAADSAGLINALMRPRLAVSEILNRLHGSAATAHDGSAAGREARGAMAALLDGDLDRLSDTQLWRLHRKLNSRRMLQLRGGLARAADGAVSSDDPGKAHVMGREFEAMGKVLDTLSASTRISLAARGFGRLDAPRTRGKRFVLGGGARKRIERDIRFFERDAQRAFTAGGGDLPPDLQHSLSAVADRVSREAADLPAFCEAGNPASEMLAVTPMFINFCAGGVMSCRLESGPGDDVILGGGFDPDDEARRAGLSRTMLEFCGGSEEQALRLSELMSRETVRLARGVLIERGAAAGGPVELPFAEGGGDLAAAWNASSRPSFSARRLGGGEIELRVEESVDLQGCWDMRRGRREQFDRTRSALEYSLRFIVPADAAQPVSLGEGRYAYQIFPLPGAGGETAGRRI